MVFQEFLYNSCEAIWKNCKQVVKLNSSFSKCETLLTGVPHDSIQGPLLFNIFLNDLFLTVTLFPLSIFTDGSTLYCLISKNLFGASNEKVPWKLHDIKCG